MKRYSFLIFILFIINVNGSGNFSKQQLDKEIANLNARVSLLQEAQKQLNNFNKKNISPELKPLLPRIQELYDNEQDQEIEGSPLITKNASGYVYPADIKTDQAKILYLINKIKLMQQEENSELGCCWCLTCCTP